MRAEAAEKALDRAGADNMQHIGGEDRVMAAAAPIGRVHIKGDGRWQAGAGDARPQRRQVRRDVRALPAQAGEMFGKKLGVLPGSRADFEQRGGIAKMLLEHREDRSLVVLASLAVGQGVHVGCAPLRARGRAGTPGARRWIRRG